MPFAPEFDDVYAAIKSTVGLALKEGTCSRLDEHQPAGPITNRLLGEIQSATMCLADVTGGRPNVMWELGYAMALGKPVIVLTQNLPDLPFDIRNLQTLAYDRNHISRTLGEPLKRMVIDTLAAYGSGPTTPNPNRERDELVGTMIEEVRSLKGMLRDAVRLWAPARGATPVEVPASISGLEGAWRNPHSRSHFYARVVRDELVVPYCYKGDHSLTGVYFGWRRTGEYWFVRFAWLDRPISGFAFLKQDSVDALVGAWWYDHEAPDEPSAPPKHAGVPARWERLRDHETPVWASRFLDQVRAEGLPSRLTSR
jgi:hypothetical protein